MCGYPQIILDWKNNIYNQYFNKGESTKIDNKLIYYSIPTNFGQSGSPLLDVKHDYVAIGIHKGKQKNSKFETGVLFTREII